MAISDQHPLYVESLPDWTMMRDAYKGERHVKSKTVQYLPPTPGMVLDGMTNETDPGLIAYNAYLMRAVFPDFVQVGVETLIGILDAKPAKIDLPKELEYLRNRATNRNETLELLLRRMFEQQLTAGRLGLLVDLPKGTSLDLLPYITLYTAESMVNWDDSNDFEGRNKLAMVVLDESGPERPAGSMSWQLKEKYRVLTLDDAGNYVFGISEDGSAIPIDKLTRFEIRGQPEKEIPFFFLNSKDMLSSPDVPPLLGLGRMCFTIYRAEADYRQVLFLQGQDTLVVIGGMVDKNEAVRVGAGARIDVNLGGDAKYVGVSGDGISEMRSSLENDRKAAAVRTGQLLAPGKASMESGEALKTRVAAQTATMTSVAKSAAQALEQVLRTIAKWKGADPEKVKVTPNLDFTNVEIAGQDIVQLITAKNLGYPVSYKTLHMIAKERGLTKNTYEEELKEIEQDPKLLIERAAELSLSLKGNNPLEGAGGPTKKPVDDKSIRPSNEPT